MPMIPYEPLFELVSFEGFHFHKKEADEQRILMPQLQRLGYTNIEFDSNHDGYFEPQVRICRCVDKEGNPHRYYYG